MHRSAEQKLSPTGLVAAAKRHSVPVVEVHHGAESQSAVTALGERLHFSAFNTAPDALIAWDCRSRDDDLTYAAWWRSASASVNDRGSTRT